MEPLFELGFFRSYFLIEFKSHCFMKCSIAHLWTSLLSRRLSRYPSDDLLLAGMRWNTNWTIIHQLAVKHHANHDVRGEQLSFGTNVAGVSSDQPEVRPVAAGWCPVAAGSSAVFLKSDA